MDKEHYNSLPKIEVSFQDHFCDCADEITTTVKYLLDKLRDLGVTPEIGTKLLLWEKDVDKDDKTYYLCNIGQIVELLDQTVKEYSNINIPTDNLVKLQDKTVMVNINKDNYFDLYELE